MNEINLNVYVFVIKINLLKRRVFLFIVHYVSFIIVKCIFISKMMLFGRGVFSSSCSRLFNKKWKDHTGIEPVTYRSAVDCSTTELIAPIDFLPHHWCSLTEPIVIYFSLSIRSFKLSKQVMTINVQLFSPTKPLFI